LALQLVDQLELFLSLLFNLLIVIFFTLNAASSQVSDRPQTLISTELNNIQISTQPLVSAMNKMYVFFFVWCLILNMTVYKIADKVSWNIWKG